MGRAIGWVLAFWAVVLVCGLLIASAVSAGPLSDAVGVLEDELAVVRGDLAEAEAVIEGLAEELAQAGAGDEQLTAAYDKGWRYAMDHARRWGIPSPEVTPDDAEVPGAALPRDSKPESLIPFLPDLPQVDSSAFVVESGKTYRDLIINVTQANQWNAVEVRNKENITFENVVVVVRPGGSIRGGGAAFDVQFSEGIAFRNVRVIMAPIPPLHRDRAQVMFAKECAGITVDGFAGLGGGDDVVAEGTEGFYTQNIYYKHVKGSTLKRVAYLDGQGSIFKPSSDEPGGNDGLHIDGAFGWGVGFGVPFSWSNNAEARKATVNSSVQNVVMCNADGMFAGTVHDGIRLVWAYNSDGASVWAKNCRIYQTDKGQPFDGPLGLASEAKNIQDRGGNEDRRDETYIDPAAIPALRAELVTYGFTRPERLPEVLR